MPWPGPAEERQQAATARLAIVLTKTANARLAELARLHAVTRAALIRSAVESWVHAPKTARVRITHAGPPPRPEPATVPVTVLVLEETATALATIAIESRSTKTHQIRRALNAVAAESGTPPLFAKAASGQKWPKADAERRPRGPAAKLKGLASRTAIGMRRARWTFDPKG